MKLIGCCCVVRFLKRDAGNCVSFVLNYQVGGLCLRKTYSPNPKKNKKTIPIGTNNSNQYKENEKVIENPLIFLLCRL